MSDLLSQIKEHATKQLKHCPYCIQHDKDFTNKYPPSGKIFVFSSSPAFCYDGRWYHLQLCNPRENSKGGFSWVDCDQHEHHEYLAIVNQYKPTLEDAVQCARDQLPTQSTWDGDETATELIRREYNGE